MTAWGNRYARPLTATGIALVAGLLALSVATSADAHHPGSSTVSQHWELLAETITNQVTSTNIGDILLNRGPLPSGTAKFNPQPTASLEVVGRHAGGTGNATWRVLLYGKSPTGGTLQLGQVTFGTADSSYTLKSASITWSATIDYELYSLVLTKTNGSGVAGTFDLRKAYVRIAQTGDLKATVGRVPLAPRQTATATLAVAADPTIYHHVAADFDPAPTIRMRVTGAIESVGTVLHARLFKLLSGGGYAVVEGAELWFDTSTFTSKQTAPLTLADDEDYALYLETVPLEACGDCDGPQPSPAGDILSADLVFEQSTADAHGLARTVGWYPSVTAATEMTSSDANLDFRFPAPSLAAVSLDRSFEATIKRTSGTGSVGARLRDLTGGTTLGTTTTTALSDYFGFRVHALSLAPRHGRTIGWVGDFRAFTPSPGIRDVLVVDGLEAVIARRPSTALTVCA